MQPWKTSRLKRPELAILGCGDVGMRLVKVQGNRTKILALARQTIIVKGARSLTIDLDQRQNQRNQDLGRLRLAKQVIYLAPPPNDGTIDSRMKHFLAAAMGVKRCVYVSTTGVYGPTKGAIVHETQRLNPVEPRAHRRIDAERRLKRSAINHVCILRAPGIYAIDRLPIERIQKGLPALIAADDVPTNHIHADDLARLCWLALYRGKNRRSYNANDGAHMMHADYLDAVANTFNLTPPPKLTYDEVKAALSPIAWSMLSGARRVSNARLVKEFKTRLLYPSVLYTLAQLPT